MKYTDPSDQLSDEDSDEQDRLHVVDTEELVREAMASLRTAARGITITSLPTDIQERRRRVSWTQDADAVR